MRFYANENFPEPAVIALRLLGHDVLTTKDAGNAGQRIPDPAVLQYATAEARAVLTHNRKDFIILHNRSSAHRGIVVATVDNDFRGLAQRVHEAVSTERDLAGKLVRVNRAP